MIMRGATKKAVARGQYRDNEEDHTYDRFHKAGIEIMRGATRTAGCESSVQR
jgi:hypothetical protein